MRDDRVYTPRGLAEALIAYAESEPSTIADLCSGDGALLEAAGGRWPSAAIFGVDIDASAIHALGSRRPSWNLQVGDLLDGSLPAALLEHAWPPQGLDLIVLNPPFSSRGAARFETPVPEGTLRSSLAMAFCIRAAHLLNNMGELLAIMPKGIVHAQRDREAWRYLSTLGRLSIADQHGRRAFPSVVMSSVVLHLERRKEDDGSLSESRAIGRPRPPAGAEHVFVGVERGRIPVYVARGTSGSSPFVHTTAIREYTLQYPLPVVGDQLPTTRGPAVLVPRVGSPIPHKMALLASSPRVVLSDCVFALHCNSEQEALALLQKVRDSWHEWSSQYGGSCAPYTTSEAVTDHLRALGVEATGPVRDRE